VKENVPMLDILLDRQVDVNVRNSEGRTPVFFAVMLKRLDVVQKLVEAGAKLEVSDGCSHTPLYYARMLGDATIERFLIDHRLTQTVIDGHS
jgi:ankyrin repeat protein